MIWKHKEKKKSKWQKWFAFYPIPIQRNNNPARFPIQDNDTIAWLTFIERRFIDSREGVKNYEYRLKGGE